MPPPPPLPDDLIEEIFLRLPPDEPACIARAWLASKEWFARLSCPRFRGRYCELHGTPPVLGFFYSRDPYSSESVEETPDPHFFSTKFRALIPNDEDEGWEYSGFDPWDCRHGRVVLGDRDASSTKLVIVDPMVGRWWEIWAPEDYVSNGAAVLSASASWCHEGPFRLVLVGIDLGDDDGDSVVYAHESLPVSPGESLSDDVWNKPSSGLHLQFDAFILPMPPVLIQDTLCFMFQNEDDLRVGILKYDLGSKCLSVIDAPLANTLIADSTMLIGMEDGSLGFAHLDWLTLNIWSRQTRSDGVVLWTECRVIHLKEFLPIQHTKNKLRLLGSMEGRDIILVSTDLGIYEINLKSLEWKKIWKRDNFCALVPYVSFFTP